MSDHPAPSKPMRRLRTREEMMATVERVRKKAEKHPDPEQRRHGTFLADRLEKMLASKR